MSPEPSAKPPRRDNLEAQTLSLADCYSLANRLAPGDAFECAALGSAPLASLVYGFVNTFAWSARRKHTGTPVGAFGFDPQSGVVWSLWTDMTRNERWEVAQKTPQWVAEMVRQSGLPFPFNYAAVRNTRALSWLHHCGCFAIDDDETIIAGVSYRRFQTRPLDV